MDGKDTGRQPLRIHGSILRPLRSYEALMADAMLVAERSIVVSSLLRLVVLKVQDVGVFESPSSATRQCPCTPLDQPWVHGFRQPCGFQVV